MSQRIGRCCCGIADCCGCRATNTLRRDWSVTVAGVTDGLCSDCEEWNGTFVLKWGDLCLWADQAATPSPCTSTPLEDDCYFHYRWLLAYRSSGPAGDGYYLEQNHDLGFNVERYFKAIADWDCDGSNVMSFHADSDGVCANWPATVTVTPNATPQPYCFCWPPYDAIAEEWEIVLDGFDGCCEEIDGTYTLVKTNGTNVPSGTVNACGFGGNIRHCSWYYYAEGILTGCDNGTLCISLQYNSYSGRISIAIVKFSTSGSHSHFGLYYMKALDFNPVGQNTFLQVGDGGTFCGAALNHLCTDRPNTVLIQPA